MSADFHQFHIILPADTGLRDMDINYHISCLRIIYFILFCAVIVFAAIILFGFKYI